MDHNLTDQQTSYLLFRDSLCLLTQGLPSFYRSTHQSFQFCVLDAAGAKNRCHRQPEDRQPAPSEWRTPGGLWPYQRKAPAAQMVTICQFACHLLISPWVRVRGCFGAPQDIRTCGVEIVNFEPTHTNVDCVSTKPSLKQPHRGSKPHPRKKSLFPRCLHGSKFAFFCRLAKPLFCASRNIVPAEQP